jgi:hypothetical protein
VSRNARAAGSAVVLAAVLAALAGCGSEPASATPAVSALVSSPTQPPPARATAAELSTAAAGRLTADHTSEVDSSSTTIVGSTRTTVRMRIGVVQDPAGRPSVRVSTEEPDPKGGSPWVNQLVLVADEAYARLDRRTWPEPKPPWIRLDPARGDPLSQQVGRLVDRVRQPSNGLGCFTDLGTNTITATAVDVLDGQPTRRYAIRTRLDETAKDPETAKQLQVHGLKDVDSTLWIDGEDRLVRCTGAVSANGASSNVEQRLISYGQDLGIEAPTPDQTVRLPR